MDAHHVDWLDPREKIFGFHIHLDFLPEHEALAMQVYEKFLAYLASEHVLPTSTGVYAARENGPHVLAGWEAKFESQDNTVMDRIGVAIGWLLCNRQGLSVLMHPVTWKEGDHHEELKAHQEHAFVLGTPPELDLTFFSDKF